MARTKNNQENEEIKENVEETTSEEITETTENEVANTDEVETTNNETEVQASQELQLKANMGFKDKYTEIVYLENTIFIVDENVEETTEIAENVYKISLKRAEELKAIGVVD